MRKITEANVDQIMDDATLLDVCAAALLVEEDAERTRRNVSRLLESVAARMGHTIDILDSLFDESRASPAPTVVSGPEVADVVFIGDEILRIWDRLAARKRAVDNGESGGK